MFAGVEYLISFSVIGKVFSYKFVTTLCRESPLLPICLNLKFLVSGGRCPLI